LAYPQPDGCSPAEGDLMHALRVARCLCLVLGFTLAAHATGSAQITGQQTPPAVPYDPTVGQQGKDVVWVPTSEKLVETMLDLAQVKADDTVIDLGSGDGRTVIAAAKRGATAHGIEYNPDMVALSKTRAAEAGVSERATFAAEDLFTSDFTRATVITMFLLPDLNLRLRPQILEMAPGTRVVSNTFTMGDWDADRTETITDCVSWCTALLWIVPAKVQGTWQTPDGPLTLEQQFQNVTGSLGNTAISGGRLNGDKIQFQAGDVQYAGRVTGGTIEGTVSGGRTGSWTATRQ
jgi:SAM-dependent methyltransferase